MRKIILASGSPQRKALMEKAGIPFEIMVTGADKDTAERDPAAYHGKRLLPGKIRVHRKRQGGFHRRQRPRQL